MNTEKSINKEKGNAVLPFVRRCFIGFLFGIGIGIGSPFIILASLIEGHNLVLELMDRMDDFWKEREVNNA